MGAINYSDIKQNVSLLTKDYLRSYPYIPLYDKRLPSITSLNTVIETIRSVIFPGYFGSTLVSAESLEYHTGVNLEKLFDLLSQQIFDAFFLESEELDAAQTKEKSYRQTAAFLDKLSSVKYLLSTDIKAILDADPAAKSYGEVIFCYPAIRALLNYRVAHELFVLGIPLIPRIITEMAHAETGIDIHPGAQIGEYFSIDHGTGVVIGQTTIIGNRVRLYQGVTLGAKSFELDKEGKPIDTPRHPILEDDVTVYSNSSILGRITIGKGTIVGGNVWLTNSVPPHSKIVQTKAVELHFSDGAGI